jgi:hypothetical protein
MRRLSPATVTDADRLDAAVARAVEHRNIAGLCDPRKRNWYGVDPGDAVRGASKLGADADEVAEAVASMLADAASPDRNVYLGR